MTEFGFRILELRLVGPTLEPAIVEFSAGLNLIHGPSNTGKSFVFQCLNYALGAEKAPKPVPESKGYAAVELLIQPTRGGNATLLSRPLRGGRKVRVQELDEDRQPVSDPTELDAAHSGTDEGTLSALLLQLSGLWGLRVRKNKEGVTRTLSFRDLVQLVLVDEQKILREASPIHSGQYTTGTVESSVFRLLLTGLDDSGIEATESKEITKTKKEAKLELLDELLRELAERLAELDPSNDRSAILVLLASTDEQIRDAHTTLLLEQSRVDEAERARVQTWKALRTSESRLGVLSELAERFELLGEQYQSDMRRLVAMAEAGTALENIPVQACPVCGAEEQHQSPAHRAKHHNPAVLAESCNAEIARIGRLHLDLLATSSRVATELEELGHVVAALTEKEAATAAEIRERLRPRAAAVMVAYREVMKRREALRAIADLYLKQVELLEKRRSVETMRAEAPPTEKIGKLSSGDAEEFALAVEALLREWGFPDLTRVLYSESDEDLVISGQERANHGKGLRALTHAAFSLGLLDYCRTGDHPHPGLVVLDTPLNPYKQKPVTDGGAVQTDVKLAFFRTVAERFADSQVIVMENSEPPTDAAFRVIEFTGGTDGRPGFIPVAGR